MTYAERLTMITGMARKNQKNASNRTELDCAVREARELFEGHEEAKMLLKALKIASYGRTMLDLGTLSLPPESLLKAGLKFCTIGRGCGLCWPEPVDAES